MLKKLFSCIVVILCVACVTNGQNAKLYNVNIVDVENGKVIPGMTVSLKNGKIDKMDRAQTYSLASGAASITDLSEISKHIQDSGKDKWEEIKAEIKDVEDKISDGTIVVTDAQSGEEFDASKCPNVTVK